MESRGFHVARLDGVPTLWREQPGPREAWLLFRMGAVDEQLAFRGVSTIVRSVLREAAASDLELPGPETPEYEPAVITSFRLRPNHPDLPGALFRLARAAADLSLTPEQLAAHYDRLRAQRAWVTPVARLLHDQFGYTGPGLLAGRTYATETVGVDDISSWAAAYLASGNALLVLNFEPADEFVLPLSEGQEMPIPQVRPRTRRGIVRTSTDPDSIAVVGLLRRGAQARRLTRRIRTKLVEEVRAAIPTAPPAAVHVDLLGHDAFSSHLVVRIETRPEFCARAADAYLAVINEIMLGAEDATTGDLTQTDPIEELLDVAVDLLLGVPAETAMSVEADDPATRPRRDAGALRDFHDSSVLYLPPGVVPSLNKLPFEPVALQPIYPTNGAYFPSTRIGESSYHVAETAMVETNFDRAVIVPWDQIAALIIDESGPVTLVGEDAAEIHWDLNETARANELTAMVRARVPNYLTVTLATPKKAKRWSLRRT